MAQRAKPQPARCCTGRILQQSEPGNSEYLEEFPLGFYWSSIRDRVVQSGHIEMIEFGELGASGPIYL